MDDELPPYAMVELYFGNNEAALTIMSRTQRYHICISTSNLHGFQGLALEQTFLDFKSRVEDDPQAMETLEEWMIKPCIPHINALVQSTPRTELPTLAEYFAPETTIIELTSNDGKLEATILPDDPLITDSDSEDVNG